MKRQVKHWTEKEKQLLISLKEKKIDVATIARILKRSMHSVTDMWVKITDERDYPRNGAEWTMEEEMALINGMKNKEFMKKFQRGQKVTNQRRFDLTRPNGKMLDKYQKKQPVAQKQKTNAKMSPYQMSIVAAAYPQGKDINVAELKQTLTLLMETV